MLMRKLAVALFAAALLASPPGAARAETPAWCGAARQAGQAANPLVDYRCTFYDGDVARVVQDARDWIAWRAPYAHNPALVLDIDETALSNWKELYQNQFVYVADGPCSFRKGATCGVRAWELMTAAPAIAPTRDLFYRAKAENVAVFFITGRREGAHERAATVTNLLRAGYAGWKQLDLRTAQFVEPSVAPYKTWARGRIEAQGYTIIANMGDQWSDLNGGHAERVFKIPNPFYFVP
jgi:HAD superfamily, subfamily IIIB (Acid phosphatase)